MEIETPGSSFYHQNWEDSGRDWNSKFWKLRREFGGRKMESRLERTRVEREKANKVWETWKEAEG